MLLLKIVTKKWIKVWYRYVEWANVYFEFSFGFFYINYFFSSYLEMRLLMNCQCLIYCNSHIDIFVWTFMCVFILLKRENFLAQILHSCNLSLLWNHSWYFKECSPLNVFEHILQENDFCSVWISSCRFSVLFLVKALSHVAHISVFSPLWIFSWSFKQALLLNVFKQVWHWWSLLLNEHFHESLDSVKMKKLSSK